jgi:hypothetical protein
MHHLGISRVIWEMRHAVQSLCWEWRGSVEHGRWHHSGLCVGRVPQGSRCKAVKAVSSHLPALAVDCKDGRKLLRPLSLLPLPLKGVEDDCECLPLGDLVAETQRCFAHALPVLQPQCASAEAPRQTLGFQSFLSLPLAAAVPPPKLPARIEPA